jgi:hypothetical protein
MHQPKIVYDTLFENMETLQQFSKTKEIQAGMIAVLHGQQLSCICTCCCISGGIKRVKMVKQPKGR